MVGKRCRTLYINLALSPLTDNLYRNLDVAEDNDIGEDMEEDNGDLVSGLLCKIVVRFEDYREFCNALKVLCGRSLQKV